MPKLEFKISKKGEITMNVDGVEGTSCMDISRPFETALGTVVDDQTKPAYWNTMEDMQTKVYEGE
jgi:hypothetical protein